MRLARGMTFTHDKILDPDWKPAPGQKYSDAPKALMEIKHVKQTGVYYGYPDVPRAQFLMYTDQFVRRFGSQL